MSRSFIIAVLVIFSCMTASELSAEVSPGARNQLAEFKQGVQAPGLSITVMRNGKVIWDEALGLADIEQNVPMTGDTVLRVGSISKTMTAVAAVRLASNGEFDLDRPVGGYLKDFSGPAASTTARQLASHLAGVRGYKDEEYISHYHYKTTREALGRFETDPLVASPGEQFLYTSAGYTLLSATLAAVEDKPFETIVSEQVWQPLGLESTGLDDVRRIIQSRARFYVAGENDALVNGELVDNSFKWAGGGMLSSTRDLAKYGSALMGEEFLSVQEKAILFTRTVTNDGHATAYGFGWYVDIEKFILDRQDKIPVELFDKLMGQVAGRQLIWHSGTAVGSVAVLMMEPSKGLVLALAVNKGDIEKELIVTALDLLTVLAQEK